MVVAGGQGYDDNGNVVYYNDVYHSPDGMNWTASTYNAAFPARAEAAAVTARNNLWFFGGNTSSGTVSDGWVSNFGFAPTYTPTFTPTIDPNSVWTQAVTNTGFTPRSGAGVAVFNAASGPWQGNRLWMVGGYNNSLGPLGDVWSSPDGVNWNLATDNVPWDEQDQVVCTAFQNKLWAFNIVVPADNGNPAVQEAFNSVDGVNWIPVTTVINFLNTNDQYFAVQNAFTGSNQLYVFTTNGGLYSSSDGNNWQSAGGVYNSFGGSGGYAPQPFFFNGGIWFYDLYPGNLFLNYSAGITYTAPFDIGDSYDAVTLNGSMYLVGNGAQDEWGSDDGKNWKQISTSLSFEPRTDYALAVFNGKIWVMGGTDPNGNSLGDVWYAPVGPLNATPTTPTSTPTPSPVFSPTPTPTPQFTPTFTPSPTLTFTPSSTPSDTSTALLSPTPTPTQALTPGADWVANGQVGYTFANRREQTTTAFNGSLYVIGGTLNENNGTPLSDIYNSSDGIHWSPVTNQAPFGARWGQAAVSFNGALWVYGGRTSQGVTNDIWTTTDGINWSEPVTSANWLARDSFQVLALNGQLWLFGGENNIGGDLNDVWESPDGVNWNPQPSAGFQPRHGFVGVAYDNQVWVIGGLENVTFYDQYGSGTKEVPQNDVWVTSDFTSWSQPTTAANFEARSYFSGAVADGRMWIMGGKAISGAVKDDVWYSCDGTNWLKANGVAGFSPREGLSALSFLNNLWVVGGTDLSGNNNGNLWNTPMLGVNEPCVPFTPTPTISPTPGYFQNWYQASASAFPARADHASVVFNPVLGNRQDGQMWVIAGGNDSQFYNDVWSSSDGVTWTQATANAGFNPRINPGAAAYNGQLWVVGGQNYDGSLDDDVWSSSDGVTWTQATGAAPFGQRTGVSLYAFDAGTGQGKQLWVMGGIDPNDNVLGDVWSSSDGKNWTQQNFTNQDYQMGYSRFPARGYQAGAAVSFAGSTSCQLMAAGGVAQDGSLLGDAWGSPDGTGWILASTPGYAPREDASAAALDHLFFVAGGMLSNGNPTNDVWFTPDGTNFQLATSNPAFSARSDHTSVAFHNKLWVLGGWDGDNYLSDVWYTNGYPPGTPTPPPTATPTDTPTPTFTYTPTQIPLPTLSVVSVPTMTCPLAASWGVSNPAGIALDPMGKVYFADYDDSLVGYLGSNGTPMTWGGLGSGIGQLDNPWGVAVGSDGLVYVTDSGNNRVEVFDGQGNYVRQWGSQGGGAGQFEIPAGIAVNSQANQVYVSSSYDDRIEIFDTQGNYQGQWGSTGTGGGLFNNPWGVSLDASGQVFVADYGNNLVQVFNGQGGFVKQWGTESCLSGAEFIAVDNANNVEYVSDALGEVGAFDPNGYPLGVFLGPGGGFDDTEGVAVGPDGLYVADYGNGKIDKFSLCGFAPTPTPTLSPTITSTPTPTSTPEILNCSQLNAWPVNDPSGIAVSSNGNVYVGDRMAGQVEVYGPGGGPVTQFGAGQFPYNNIFGVALDARGYAYATDSPGSTVNVFDNNYNPVTQWSTSANMWSAAGLAVNSALGLVYVADDSSQSIEVFTTNGVPVTQWGNGLLNTPWGVAVDGSGNVYVADYATYLVDVFTAQGSPVTQWDVTQGTPLLSADFISVDNNGIVYVADYFGTVGQFTASGTLLGFTQTQNQTQGYVWVEGIGAGNGAWYLANEAQYSVEKFADCSGAVPIPTPALTPASTPTATCTPSDTPAFTGTDTPSFTPTATSTGTMTATPSDTATSTATETPTQTFTVSSTDTSTATASYTPTATPTDSNTETPTTTPTFTPSFTATPTPTNTSTATPTTTASSTTTDTPTATASETKTFTATFTMTETPTFTETQTPTATATDSSTSTATPTATSTPTPTCTETTTFTPSATSTSTPTSTETDTPTGTPTFTATSTCTSTLTATPTSSTTATETQTYSNTPTETASFTQTATPTETPTFTQTPTSTQTQTPTFTQTKTPTFTQTQTLTFTQTLTPAFTQTQTPTFTQTQTPTFTPMMTPTFTQTQTPTYTSTTSPTFTQTQTPTFTSTATLTFTKTNTPTLTTTYTPTSTPTQTSTATRSATTTVTFTSTPTRTPTATLTFTSTNTPTKTMTSGFSPTSTKSPTKTPTVTTTSTPTKTPTNTMTFTKTITATWTNTWTITPSPTATTQCGVNTAALALLEEYTSSCTSNSVYHLFSIVNNGAAVTLSDITIKFWPYDTSGVSLVGSITTGGCVWNPTCSHSVTGVSLSALNFSPACGPTTTQMANWEMTVATTDNTVLSGGTSWVNLQTLVNRADSQPFVPGTSHWYSPCVNSSVYTTNSHFAIYLKGNLVAYAGGVPPSCRPVATCTPSGKAILGSNRETPTPTLSATLTPVPTVIPDLVQSVVAAPNISRDGEPIKLLVNLSKPAHIILYLYTLAGEKAYDMDAQGTAGLNTLVWNLQNNANQAVASGFYIYMVTLDDGERIIRQTGKVVVIH